MRFQVITQRKLCSDLRTPDKFLLGIQQKGFDDPSECGDMKLVYLSSLKHVPDVAFGVKVAANPRRSHCTWPHRCSTVQLLQCAMILNLRIP